MENNIIILEEPVLIVESEEVQAQENIRRKREE